MPVEEVAVPQPVPASGVIENFAALPRPALPPIPENRPLPDPSAAHPAAPGIALHPLPQPALPARSGSPQSAHLPAVRRPLPPLPPPPRTAAASRRLPAQNRSPSISPLPEDLRAPYPIPSGRPLPSASPAPRARQTPACSQPPRPATYTPPSAAAPRGSRRRSSIKHRSYWHTPVRPATDLLPAAVAHWRCTTSLTGPPTLDQPESGGTKLEENCRGPRLLPVNTLRWAPDRTPPQTRSRAQAPERRPPPAIPLLLCHVPACVPA